MAQPEQRNNIDGVKFTVAEAAAALAAVSSDIVEQERLLIKYAKRTLTEKIVMKEIYHRLRNYNKTAEPWVLTAATEMIYDQRGKHLYADQLGKVRDERQQKRDRRKRSLTDKLNARMYEIYKLKNEDVKWSEIIKYLKTEHRGQFYKETITTELIRHLYYEFKKTLPQN